MEEMSKFCFSRTTTTTTTATSSTTITTTTTTTTTITHFSTLILSDFLFFSSYIFSHPLYFSYFIFFSPYLLKLLSFLSPLFITTSLLLLALLTVSPNLIDFSEISESKAHGFLLNAYNTIINTLCLKLDSQNNEKFELFEELEACILLIQEYPYEVSDQNMEDKYIDSITTLETDGKDIEDNQDKPFTPERSNVQLSEVLEKSKRFDSNLEDCELTDKQNQVVQIGKEQYEPNVTEYPNKMLALEVLSNEVRYGDFGERRTRENLIACGSMRKEKEWKRTLACKLYEERLMVDGSEEGMDSLWESYETDFGKMKVKKKEKKMVGKKAENVNDYEDEDEKMDDPICCLQALKLSSGKMNLGMKKPNLVKFSKALKGIGWFHQVSRHGKKV